MLCRTDNILRNAPHIQLEWWKIPHNIVKPTEHCYGYEWCYVFEAIPVGHLDLEWLNMSSWVHEVEPHNPQKGEISNLHDELIKPTLFIFNFEGSKK